MFIGSSREALPIAEAFRNGLKDHVQVTLWSDLGVFPPGFFPLESLEAAVNDFPHALIVFKPEDLTTKREITKFTARDNAVFELGLFVGRHGRRSAFVAVPQTAEMHFPSDLLGLEPVRYRAVDKDDKVESYDVKEACDAILKALRAIPPKPRTHPQPSPFWDVLSNQIVILYGVEHEINVHPHPRHRISLRDLGTSLEIRDFLQRQYPHKMVRLLPASQPGLPQQMHGADLIIVGGFVTNAEFAKHRHRYEHYFRLKMGRLCVVEGQRIHVPEFRPPDGSTPPDVRDPQGVEDFPTEWTAQDFGLVFNGPLHMYGQNRRVVAIAGVKGHGTHGSATYLIGDSPAVDTQLRERPLESRDTLEIVVGVDVVNDAVNRSEALTVRFNGECVFDAPRSPSRPCELNRPCDGCDFGVKPVVHPRLPSKMLTSQIRAIVFDLDDTLIDTFGTLIMPLEMQAARLMIAAPGAPMTDENALAAALLRSRRVAPQTLEADLRKRGFPRDVLQLRHDLLEKVSLENLVVSPEVRQLLKELEARFELYLLTAGKREFQRAKIKKLAIRSHFAGVNIVSNSSSDAKKGMIERLAARRDYKSENVLIVGNRLDSEIAAGNRLNMPTVWIRHGEGADLKPGPHTGMPDHEIRSVLDLRKVLWPWS
ncbi:MAG: nucleotide-binding protein [Acidobacteria bacterium]|nr:nucleotide-binding protein [Acidobacteriota bacterium]